MSDELDWLLKLREADQRLAEAREQHHREIREADQRALDLVRGTNDVRFAQLAENTERANTLLSRQQGTVVGSDRTIAWLIAATGVLFGVAGIIFAILNL